MLTFRFSGTEGRMTEWENLTSGMVGKHLMLEFSPEWDDLVKTVVFSNGRQSVSRLYTAGAVVIPAEILKKPLKTLTVGVYGVSADGKLVIPTVRAEGPRIQPGVEPGWEPEADPELPVWAQLQAQLGDLSQLETEAKDNLVSAVNELAEQMLYLDGEDGVTFIPSVSAEGELTWTNDAGLENPAPVNIRGPQGMAGEAPWIRITVIDGGHRLEIIQGEKMACFDIMDGHDGYTPVRGVDYWTEEDQAAIKSYVDEVAAGAGGGSAMFRSRAVGKLPAVCKGSSASVFSAEFESGAAGAVQEE